MRPAKTIQKHPISKEKNVPSSGTILDPYKQCMKRTTCFTSVSPKLSANCLSLAILVCVCSFNFSEIIGGDLSFHSIIAC